MQGFKFFKVLVDNGSRYPDVYNMTLKDFNVVLYEWYEEAQRIQRENDFDYVVYASVEYDDEGNIKLAHLYNNMLGLSEKEFNKRTEEFLKSKNGKVFSVKRFIA